MLKILLVLTIFNIGAMQAQSIIGKWKTIDDNTGKEKSIIEIVERDGKAYGRIIKLFRNVGEDADPVCDKCESSDARYQKKIIGMEIIKDMVKDGDEYSGGNIMDPENGKTYSCKLWIEGGDLKVRGYWGLFYRTQTWKKYL